MEQTSDERRKVADKLMQMANAHEATEASRVAHALGLEYKVYGTVVAFDSADIRNLADLIDPTCNMKSLDTGEQADYECSEHIMHCKNCGAEFGYVLYGEDGDVSMDDKPKFCPECGARVVGK